MSEDAHLRCLRCSSTDLARSGREPHRHICQSCGQHYFLVLQMVPVPSDNRPLLLTTDAKQDSGAD